LLQSLLRPPATARGLLRRTITAAPVRDGCRGGITPTGIDYQALYKRQMYKVVSMRTARQGEAAP